MLPPTPDTYKGVDHALRPVGYVAEIAEIGAGGLRGLQAHGPAEGYEHLLPGDGTQGGEGAAPGAGEDACRHALGYRIGVPGVSGDVGIGADVRLLCEIQKIDVDLGHFRPGQCGVGVKSVFPLAVDYAIACPAFDGFLRPVAFDVGKRHGESTGAEETHDHGSSQDQ